MENQGLIISFARSGGTLLNKILGCHPEAVILSEVNPAGEAVVDLAVQAKEWFGLINEDERIWLVEKSFSDKILFIKEKAEKIGKRLIVRDWVTVNFMSGDIFYHGAANAPSKVLEALLYLQAAGISCKPLVITRKCEDVYRSLAKNVIRLNQQQEDQFFADYLDFAKSTELFPKIKLEDVQHNAKAHVKKALEFFSLAEEYLESILMNFSRFERCTGNNTLPSRPASDRWLQIQKTPRQTDPSINISSANLQVAHLADKILGYP